MYACAIVFVYLCVVLFVRYTQMRIVYTFISTTVMKKKKTFELFCRSRNEYRYGVFLWSNLCVSSRVIMWHFKPIL